MSPENRLYFPTLLFTLIFCFSIRKKPKYKTEVAQLFSKKYWLDPSSLDDFKLLALNSFIKTLIIFFWINLIPKTTIIILRFLRDILPEIDPLPVTGSIILFTFVTFIFDDFSRFFTHYIFHRVPILWKFHRVHHSAKVLTPVTLFRSHPVEAVAMFFRNILTYSFITALFIYFYRTKISGLEILGVNALGISFNFALSNLRHSPVPITFGRFEKVFLSPFQHQIHHSAERSHYNKNFGICLSIWDKLFNTFLSSKNVKIERFGL